MDRKFIVVATSREGGRTSLWTNEGWITLWDRTLSDSVNVAALDSEQACKVRDDAKKHNIGGEYTIQVIRIA